MTAPPYRPPATSPLFSWSPVDSHRLWTVGVLVVLAGTAALALVGLPPIDLHEPTHYLGVMAPTCGMTRAVRFLALGDPGRAWAYNPAVFVLAAAGAAGAVRVTVGLLTNKWWQPQIRHRRALLVIGIAALAALWVNQQAHAELLMGP